MTLLSDAKAFKVVEAHFFSLYQLGTVYVLPFLLPFPEVLPQLGSEDRFVQN